MTILECFKHKIPCVIKSKFNGTTYLVHFHDVNRISLENFFFDANITEGILIEDFKHYHAENFKLIDYIVGNESIPTKCICDFYAVIMISGCRCGGV